MTPAGKIKVQIAGVAWLDALESSFVADNEHWFEQTVMAKDRGSYYVAWLDPGTALMLAHALEGQSKVIWGPKTNQRRTSLERVVLRVRADAAVMGFHDD